MIELPDHPWFVAGQFHPEFRSRPTRPHPLFRDFVGAATAFADARDRAAAAPTPTPAPGVRTDGVPVHRNGGEPVPEPTPTPTRPASAPDPAAGRPRPALVPEPVATPARAAEEPAVPRVPIIDANPRPEVASRFAAPADPAPTVPAPAPPTVDLRSDGLADPIRHDDDPPVPAGPVGAGDPGRP
jgi:hypothetical protein